MPTSIPSNVPAVVEYLALAFQYLNSTKRKKSGKLKVLDIGVGLGTWGFVLRNYLDIPDFNLTNPYSTKKRRIHLTGIEIFKKYIGPQHKFLYDKLIIGDALKTLDKKTFFDVAILGDVIEHFELETGKKLLKKVLKRCSLVVVSTPNGLLHQGKVYGNEAEEHLSGWTMNEFKEFNVLHHTLTLPSTSRGQEIVPLLVVLIAQGKPKANKIKGSHTFYRLTEFVNK